MNGRDHRVRATRTRRTRGATSGSPATARARSSAWNSHGSAHWSQYASYDASVRTSAPLRPSGRRLRSTRKHRRAMSTTALPWRAATPESLSRRADQHHVDVRRVVELAATELAHADDREAVGARRARRTHRARRRPCRRAPPATASNGSRPRRSRAAIRRNSWRFHRTSPSADDRSTRRRVRRGRSSTSRAPGSASSSRDKRPACHAAPLRRPVRTSTTSVPVTKPILPVGSTRYAEKHAAGPRGALPAQHRRRRSRRQRRPDPRRVSTRPRPPAATSRCSRSWPSPATRPRTCCSSPASSGPTARRSRRWRPRTGRCAAVVGFVDADRDLYNAAAVCADGRVAATYHKRHLPNYAVFDEQRYFAAGSDPLALFEIAGVKVGVSICEDAWSPFGPIGEQAAGGAELIAQPQRVAVLRRPAARARADARDPGRRRVLHARLRQPGRRPGRAGLRRRVAGVRRRRQAASRGRRSSSRRRSSSTSTSCRCSASGCSTRGDGPWRRALPVIEVTGDRGVTTKRRFAAEPSHAAADARARSTRHWCSARATTSRRTASPTSCSALSGGIDSSLVTVIAADAIGAEHVHAVALPSRYSSEGSITDAERLCANLGIELRTIPIEPAYAAMLEMLAPSFDGRRARHHRGEPARPHPGRAADGAGQQVPRLARADLRQQERAGGRLHDDLRRRHGRRVRRHQGRAQDEGVRARPRPQRVGRLRPHPERRARPSRRRPSCAPGQRDDQNLPPYEVLDPILAAYVERRPHPRPSSSTRGFDPVLVHRITRWSTSPSGSADRRRSACGSRRRRSARTAACRSPTSTRADPLSSDREPSCSTSTAC